MPCGKRKTDMTDTTPLFIDTLQALAQLCRQLETSPWLAIDTEFLRESTYYPQFCLLQIANQDIVACIDPLQLEDLEPLWQLLYRPEIIKVFHAGRQDLEIFYHLHGKLPAPVFDTQIAAPLLGFSDQIGYAQLVAEVLGVQLEKGHSRTDWRKRPLSPQQLQYAADDVRYLGPMYLELRQQLEKLHRLSWLEEDFATLTNPATYANPPEDAWRRIKGARKLKGKQLAILKQLASWRERTAVEHNLPRGWVLKDDLLCQIARLRPKTPQALAQLRGIGDKIIKRHGETICRLIAETTASDAKEAPYQPPTRTPEQEALLDLLSAVVRLQAAEHHINPTVLASRRDLEKFLDAPDDSKLCQGWRQQLIGRDLQDFMAGKKRLQIEQGRVYLEAS